jgi:hypothetical protein
VTNGCDEVFIRINGTQHYLWRAVDQHGNVLDILVQSRRNAVAAKRFFRTLLKNLGLMMRTRSAGFIHHFPPRSAPAQMSPDRLARRPSVETVHA